MNTVSDISCSLVTKGMVEGRGVGGAGAGGGGEEGRRGGRGGGGDVYVSRDPTSGNTAGMQFVYSRDTDTR